MDALERIALFLRQRGVKATTPAGRKALELLSAFVAFENQMARKRGRPTIPPETEQAVRDMLATGAGILKTAATIGVGSGTVQRVRKAMQRDGEI